MENYKKLSAPPADALKTITGGRLKGKTDINPQWRIEAMTEVYGACGIGWKYEVVGRELVEGSDGQIAAFADVLLYIKTPCGQWSDPIPGSGGSMFVVKETGGLHTSDEAYKMATTDALSVAMKFLGVAADVYRGRVEGGSEKTKYTDDPRPWLNKETKTTDGHSALDMAKKWIKDGGSVDDIEKKYRLSKEMRAALNKVK